MEVNYMGDYLMRVYPTGDYLSVGYPMGSCPMGGCPMRHRRPPILGYPIRDLVYGTLFHMRLLYWSLRQSYGISSSSVTIRRQALYIKSDRRSIATAHV